MRMDFYYPSCGTGQIHGCRWTPEGTIRGVFQIVHGIAEHVERYDEFAEYLNQKGVLVVAEDHMGHGKSIDHGGTKGYFDGGWKAAVQDCVQLLQQTRQEFPDLPYVLFGHSMGSFLVRSILIAAPDSGIDAAVICGTGWQNSAVLRAGVLAAKSAARKTGEREPSEKLQNMIFGGYNKRVEHERTPFDWLSRDCRVVDEYIADPMCGFTASTGLLRDMLEGMLLNQKKENLKRMQKDLPVLLVGGGADPVGSYGAGVRQTGEQFTRAGMENVTVRLFPMCRHEILNEINREEVFDTIWDWIVAEMPKYNLQKGMKIE